MAKDRMAQSAAIVICVSKRAKYILVIQGPPCYLKSGGFSNPKEL